MANEYAVLDGIAPSWADLTATVAGYTGGVELDIKDIASITTGVAIEIGEQRGTGGQLRRRTRGQATYEGAINFYQDGYEKFGEMLLETAPRENGEALIGLVHWDLVIQFMPPGTSRIYTRKLLGCRMAGSNLNPTEGVDANQVEVPVSVAKILDMIGNVPVRLI